MFKLLPENNSSFGKTKPNFGDARTQDVGWSFELLKSNEQLDITLIKKNKEDFPNPSFPHNVLLL